MKKIGSIVSVIAILVGGGLFVTALILGSFFDYPQIDKMEIMMDGIFLFIIGLYLSVISRLGKLEEESKEQKK
jgi:hypothetical protein